MGHRFRRLSASFCLACFTALPAIATAAPTATPSAGTPAAAKAKPISVKEHKKKRGISKWEASLPSRSDRALAAGAEMTVVHERPWATVSVRTPVATTAPNGAPYATYAGDRAALSFVDPQFVDARSGWATWRGPGGLGLPGGLPGGSSSTEEQLDAALCALLGVGCDDDGPQVDVDLNLWVKASAGHDYVAVCRVKFDDKVGTLDIASEASTLSAAIDHTGKQSATVSFVIDANGAGWYGVGIASDEEWSTTGCTIDEV